MVVAPLHHKDLAWMRSGGQGTETRKGGPEIRSLPHFTTRIKLGRGVTGGGCVYSGDGEEEEGPQDVVIPLSGSS